MALAERAACAAESCEAVSQSAAALHSWTLHSCTLRSFPHMLAVAFPPEDENGSGLEGHSGFQNSSDSLM